MIMDSLAGQTLNHRYSIIRLLGSGGMGAVYLAHDAVLERHVAIKLLQVDPTSDQVLADQVRLQFQREAQTLAGLHHPNLPRVTDYFTEEMRHYLVMDYIEGQTLEDIMRAQPGGLDEALVLEWADQLLSALEYIHAHHLIHRDLKPSNIRRTSEGRIFLVDFGLVKPYDPEHPHTLTMIHGLGTPEYSPPEQYDLKSHTDERSDLYALGATLYHLLTGQAPASVTRRASDPTAFQTPRAANARISPEVERVIVRAMELERAQRFASAADMRAALRMAHLQPAETLSSTLTLPLTPEPREPQPGPSRKRRRLLGGVVVLGLLALIVAGLAWASNRGGAPVSTPAPLAPAVTLVLLSGTTMPEYLVIQNAGSAPQDLSGWYVESVVGQQVFNFPGGYTLPAAGSVRIESFSGAVNNPPASLLWSTDAIWRNAGDKAILRNPAGVAVSTLCYGDACP